MIAGYLVTLFSWLEYLIPLGIFIIPAGFILLWAITKEKNQCR